MKRITRFIFWLVVLAFFAILLFVGKSYSVPSQSQEVVTAEIAVDYCFQKEGAMSIIASFQTILIEKKVVNIFLEKGWRKSPLMECKIAPQEEVVLVDQDEDILLIWDPRDPYGRYGCRISDGGEGDETEIFKEFLDGL